MTIFEVHRTLQSSGCGGARTQEEARELSVSNYGRDEWWLLLDAIEGASS